MEVVIYDWPPSTGTSLWVETKIWNSAWDDMMVVPHFIRLRTLRDISLPDKVLLASVRDRFQEIITEAAALGKKQVIFDGSPATLVALEHFNTGIVSSKSKKAIARYLSWNVEKVSVVLLLPQWDFWWPSNMRSFDRDKVVPFWQSLELAYTLAWFKPTIVDIARSPYVHNH